MVQPFAAQILIRVFKSLGANSERVIITSRGPHSATHKRSKNTVLPKMQHDIFLYLWSTCSYRLYSFLGVRDIAHLDSAFSNHAIRKQFHSCLSRSSFVGLVYSRVSKEWIAIRNLAPDGLLLEHGITENDIAKLGEFCRGVERVSVRPTFESSPSVALSKILQHSPKLKVFMPNRYENVGTMVYRTIAEKCKNLSELTVQTNDLDIATIQAIFQSCSKLTKINLSVAHDDLQDSLVASIAVNCLNLTSLALSPVGSLSADAIQKLTARCSCLTTLRLAYLSPTLHNELLELAAHCRMLTVLDLQLTVLNIAILPGHVCSEQSSAEAARTSEPARCHRCRTCACDRALSAVRRN